MHFTLYEWSFIVLNIFGTYTIYKYMEIFFEIRKSNVIIEFFTYFLYALFITVIFLFVNIPIILMTCNLIAFILLTFNYESTVKKRIVSVLLIYLILMCVELVVGLASGYFDFFIFSVNHYSSIYGLVVTKILSYAVVLILKNFKNIKKGETVPNSNWLCIVLIPLTSLYMILLLFQAEGLKSVQVLAGIILFLLINFATFYLYDKIIVSLSEKMQNLLIIEQNEYFNRQLNLMKTSLEAIKTIRHDLKNHMFAIQALIEGNETEKALEHISLIMNSIGAKKDYAVSGNSIIDSTINFKLQGAEHNGIKTTVDLNIPEDLKISSFDLTVILGNLLDNAIEATLKVKEGRFIDVKMKYDKGRLLIRIDNSYRGEIKEEKGRLLTTKENKNNHGIGITSVKKVIQKYDGQILLDYSGQVFSVSILLFLES